MSSNASEYSSTDSGHNTMSCSTAREPAWCIAHVTAGHLLPGHLLHNADRLSFGSSIPAEWPDKCSSTVHRNIMIHCVPEQSTRCASEIKTSFHYMDCPTNMTHVLDTLINQDLQLTCLHIALSRQTCQPTCALEQLQSNVQTEDMSWLLSWLLSRALVSQRICGGQAV